MFIFYFILQKLVNYIYIFFYVTSVQFSYSIFSCDLLTRFLKSYFTPLQEKMKEKKVQICLLVFDYCHI